MDGKDVSTNLRGLDQRAKKKKKKTILHCRIHGR